MGISIGPLLVILAIVLLVFGAKKLKTLGSDLGGAVKGFKAAMDDEGEAKKDAPPVMLKQKASTEQASNDTQQAKYEDKV